jgi:hypothetical protein
MRLSRLALLGLLASACGGGNGHSPGPSFSLEADPLEFGGVVVGDPTERLLVVRNPADAAPAEVTDVTVDLSDFVIALLPPLPVRIDPGDRLSLRIVSRPTVEGPRQGTLTVRAGPDALAVELRATGLPSEEVLDFGALPLGATTRETSEVEIEVPANAISLTIEAFGDTDGGGPIFLASLTGPGGKVYVDVADPHAGPYLFERNFPSDFFQLPVVPLHDSRFQIPNTDDPSVQLVPGGGTYRFRLSNLGGSLATLRVRVHLELRTSGASDGRFPLNVFLAAGLPVSAAQAATDPPLQEALGEAQRLLGRAGLGFATVTYSKLASPAFDHPQADDTGPLFERSTIAPGEGVNVFFVVSIPFAVAGAIPGGKRNGTPYSGIVVPYPGTYTPLAIGATVAHEISHYLGLGHTLENPGLPWTHDLILDTTECAVPACDDNLMDAIAIGSELTPGQAHVIRRHHLVEPGPPSFVPGVTLLAGRDPAGPHPPCATCRR